MGCSKLLAALLLILSLCRSSLGQTYIMVAPNILRVGSEENIYLESSVGGEVDLTVMDFPLKRSKLYGKKLILGDNNQALHQLKLDQKDFKSNVRGNQYVYLKATFRGRQLETVVLVSFQSGYVFLQTDKPIYNPGEDVKYRLFVTNLEAKAAKGIVGVGLKSVDGTIVSQTKMGLSVNGLLAKQFLLPDIVKEEGTWTLEVKLQSEPDRVFNTSFDVKKHVLPTFEVTLKTRKQYLHVQDHDFKVDLEARYFSGTEVVGYAYFMFGYVCKNGMKIQLPTLLQRHQLQTGTTTAILIVDQIIAAAKDVNNIYDILECSLYARATVFTTSGSDIVTAELTGIKVVKSPYSIYFTKSSRFFKPGLPFNLHVYLTDTSGSPVKDIEIESEGQKCHTDSHGIAVITINTVRTDKIRHIQVTTAVSDLLNSSHQARKDITLLAYETKTVKEYIHLSLDKSVVKKDESLYVAINFLGENGVQVFQYDFISYMVVSKGRIIEMGKWNSKDKALLKETLKVTPDMLPSFRLVAFYIVPSQGYDVVADSLWVDVEDQCMGQLKLSIKKSNKRPDFRPREEFSLNVEGDPGAKVGLVVVDKAAYMLSKKGSLKQAKIWDEVERSDKGCTWGGGRNNMAIFSDAGLLFVSNQEKTAPRQRFSCDTEVPKRRRQAESLKEAKYELARQYEEDAKRCCHDGMMDFPLDYSCEKRSHYITEGPKCVEAFLRCCQGIQKDQIRFTTPELILARTNEYFFDEDEEDIIIRSKFDVSWMWTTILLSGNETDAGIVTYEKTNMVLQDSITQWMVLGISTSETKGVCVAEPVEMTVVKNFYVDLRLPYSVVNREQVQIKVVIHNYDEESQKVTVLLKASENLCTATNYRGSYREIINVDKKSQKVLYVTVIPMKPGKHQITVTARSEYYRDGIEKQLLVVPEGVEKTILKERLLQPNVMNGKQKGEVYINLKNMLPDTVSSTYITIEGDSLADTVINSIGGAVLSELIKMPGGCVEQNLVSMTAPIIATHYLDHANAWEEVGVEKRAEALQYVNLGYQRHLGYKNSDDTYSPYGKDGKPSTWVTAYTAKVFAMVHMFGGVEDERVCIPLKFLVKKQNSAGIFQEEAPINSWRLTGGIYEEGDVATTAFVLIAMQETLEICKDTGTDQDGAMKKASEYIFNALPAQSSPYSVAISSYALALTKKYEWKDKLLKELDRTSTGGTHWGGNDDKGVEATGYALSALVTLGELKRSEAVSDWLVAKSRANGQFGNTQCTIVVFQALSLFQKQKAAPPGNSISVSLSVNSPVRTGESSSIKWNLDQRSRFMSRSERIPQLTDFTFEAKGSGKAKLKVLTTYYTMLVKEKSVCKGFNMSHSIEKINEAKAPEGVVGVYKLTICVRPLEGTSIKMAILDVSLPSGFVPDYTSLNELLSRKDKLIDFYQLDKELSDKGSLIIHIYDLSPSPNSDYCVPVTLYQEFTVRLLQPSSIKVYSYYEPEKSCTRFYSPFKNSTDEDIICSKNGCACIDKNCPSVKKAESLTASDREEEACVWTNPVYNIQVKHIQEDENTLIKYKMEIQKAYKLGNDLKVDVKTERDFYAHRMCQTSLGLKKDKLYLFIGNPKDIILGDDGSYSYVLSGNTWLEEFESGGEQATFLNKLETSGCST
ncbi:complement C3 [Salmo salar]|uniref:Complement C3 n=1 Tax=Salmo salar TaxID=8030 RepID=A0A1S3LZ12_SALSA|nr:complement C3 [Salmo salar]|eukprot:XP_013996147.1 PREDICTED: complement C3-like isoform X1 [Salmo salar]